MSAKVLTMKQVAERIGTNLGTVILMRSKGARYFDPTFPPMTHGTFNAADIAAWQAARTTPPTTTVAGQPVAPQAHKNTSEGNPL